jgi:Tfp pilus assembly ATPase PilU
MQVSLSVEHSKTNRYRLKELKKQHLHYFVFLLKIKKKLAKFASLALPKIMNLRLLICCKIDCVMI